ncbi:hypothetical protein FIBSPDRAFT_894492 [Athelia psychrophila]|uniref:Uncharacterized protein n=1 Tax=Athelia psychrophila TaxID=1759441 RepID=A0A166FRG4_9AGAM|nr:hypothetical protein FIBSPDRAFT_894492 [Fibularhizoctonia sp. CBS 109695]
MWVSAALGDSFELLVGHDLPLSDHIAADSTKSPETSLQTHMPDPPQIEGHLSSAHWQRWQPGHGRTHRHHDYNGQMKFPEPTVGRYSVAVSISDSTAHLGLLPRIGERRLRGVRPHGMKKYTLPTLYHKPCNYNTVFRARFARGYLSHYREFG